MSPTVCICIVLPQLFFNLFSFPSLLADGQLYLVLAALGTQHLTARPTVMLWGWVGQWVGKGKGKEEVSKVKIKVIYT